MGYKTGMVGRMGIIQEIGEKLSGLVISPGYRGGYGRYIVSVAIQASSD